MPHAIIVAAIAIGEAAASVTGSAAVGAAIGNFGFALAGASAGGLAATASAWALTATVIGGLISLSGALKPGVPKPEAADQALKQPIPPRVYGYGIRRLFGAYVLFESSGGVSYDVLALCDGMSDGVVQYYLNDDPVDVASNFVGGLTDGRYSNNRVLMDIRFGEDTETAYAAPVIDITTIWTDTHRGDGVTSLALKCIPANAANFLKIYPNGLPKPSAALQLQPVWDPRA